MKNRQPVACETTSPFLKETENTFTEVSWLLFCPLLDNLLTNNLDLQEETGRESQNATSVIKNNALYKM